MSYVQYGWAPIVVVKITNNKTNLCTHKLTALIASLGCIEHSKYFFEMLVYHIFVNYGVAGTKSLNQLMLIPNGKVFKQSYRLNIINTSEMKSFGLDPTIEVLYYHERVLVREEVRDVMWWTWRFYSRISKNGWHNNLKMRIFVAETQCYIEDTTFGGNLLGTILTSNALGKFSWDFEFTFSCFGINQKERTGLPTI